MRVLPSTLVEGNKVTVLEGRVSDQAELAGASLDKLLFWWEE
jgi:hypothetical protein